MCHDLCLESVAGCPVRRAERLHALTELLRRRGARGCTAAQIAAEFGVSERTVKRDLDAPEASGAPVWSRRGPGGGYGLAAGTSLPPVTLSPAQAVALMAAVSASRDAPYADLAAAGIEKIVDVLDPRTRARALDLAGRVWVDSPSSRASRRVRSALEEAMASQRVVRIRYTSGKGSTTSRDVEPVLLARRGGAWYLVGWCRLRDAMRWFAVERVERADVTTVPCSGHTVDEVGEPPMDSRPVHGSVRVVPDGTTRTS